MYISLVALVDELEAVILDIQNGRQLDCFTIHNSVKHMYTWQNVAARTERVYDNISEEEDWIGHQTTLTDQLNR